LVGAPAAHATGQSLTVPVGGVLPSPCTLEPVLLTGTAHMMFNSSDGHFTGEGNLQGVSGVGMVSGYHYVDQTQQTEWSRFTEDGSSAGHTEFSEHLIRQRETPATPLTAGDDWYAKFLFHVSFDADGVPTVYQDMSGDGCR
jgi:hypothetical protein